jgi:hypothetical protein
VNTSGGGVGYDAAAAINAPLADDKAALRVSGFYTHDSGFIDNLASGRDDVNESKVYGGRADLFVKPADQLSLRLAVFAQDIERDGTASADFGLASGEPVDGDLDQRRLRAEPFEQEFRLVSGTLTYDFGNAALTSISSIRPCAATRSPMCPSSSGRRSQPAASSSARSKWRRRTRPTSSRRRCGWRRTARCWTGRSAGSTPTSRAEILSISVLGHTIVVPRAYAYQVVLSQLGVPAPARIPLDQLAERPIAVATLGRSLGLVATLANSPENLSAGPFLGVFPASLIPVRLGVDDAIVFTWSTDALEILRPAPAPPTGTHPLAVGTTPFGFQAYARTDAGEPDGVSRTNIRYVLRAGLSGETFGAAPLVVQCEKRDRPGRLCVTHLWNGDFTLRATLRWWEDQFPEQMWLPVITNFLHLSDFLFPAERNPI